MNAWSDADALSVTAGITLFWLLFTAILAGFPFEVSIRVRVLVGLGIGVALAIPAGLFIASTWMAVTPR